MSSGPLTICYPLLSVHRCDKACGQVNHTGCVPQGEMMAKTATSSDGPGAFGRRLIAARENIDRRLDWVAVKVQEELQTTTGPSRETIRRMEQGDITETKADMMIVAALAKVYGVSIASLSPIAAERLRGLTPFLVADAKAKPTRPRSSTAATSAKGRSRPITRWTANGAGRAKVSPSAA